MIENINYENLSNDSFLTLIRNTKDSIYKQILVGSLQDAQNKVKNKAGLMLSKLVNFNVEGYQVAAISENSITLLNDNEPIVKGFILRMTPVGSIEIADYTGAKCDNIDAALNTCIKNLYKKYYLSEIFELENLEICITYQMNKITDNRNEASNWAQTIKTNSEFKVLKKNGKLELKENDEAFLRIKELSFIYVENGSKTMISQNDFFTKLNNQLADGEYFFYKKSTGVYNI